MDRRFRFHALLVILICALAGPAGADPGVLVLGRISDDPQRHHGQLRPLLDYVVPRMADVGIREGRILMAPDASRMTSYLRHGRVDWVTETASTGLTLMARAGATVLLQTERDGVRRYHSVLFVRDDSPVRTVHDLRGRRIALQSPASTSAYLLPAIALLDAGVPMEILPSPADRPRADGVGYVFANTEGNIATWVLKGVVDAGAFSDVDLERMRGRDPRAAALRVVGISRSAPRALEIVRGDLDPRVRARLRQVLLEAASDPQAGPALQRFFGTTGFTVPTEGDAAALAVLAEAARRTREAIE
ncbi:MAG TPA: metal-binding protein [Xanthomonadaceae bacterium]|jgi:phosphonate transport system substrate-binding protein|nr:metal-binding protein [Xanthomonadaceae bacterium]